MQNNNFYRAFEDKYRGSRELIKSRLEVYLPFVKKIKDFDSKPNAIDLGCGRGEWLELLSENDYKIQGVDLDAGMLKACQNRGFDVAQKDAILALKELDDNSCWIVSGFHLAEHLPFEVLQSLVQEALRVLKPGGFIILETPNPENIEVATANFYLDPTHIRPIPSELLSFLTEYYGFGRTKVLRLQESQELHNVKSINISQIISGVSPDYAVVAQKQAPVEIMSSFDELFNREYGLSLETLANKFENRLLKLESHANEAIAKAEQAQIQANEVSARAEQAQAQINEANARAEQAQAQANEAWQNYAMVVNSNSWKLTKPLRFVGKFVRWFVRGSYHWLAFSPTSRPRRIVKNMLLQLKNNINANPKLKIKIISTLNRFPALKARLKRVGQDNYFLSDNSKLTAWNALGYKSQNLELSHLSPEAKKIYNDLKYAIEQKQKASK